MTFQIGSKIKLRAGGYQGLNRHFLSREGYNEADGVEIVETFDRGDGTQDAKVRLGSGRLLLVAPADIEGGPVDPFREATKGLFP